MKKVLKNNHHFLIFIILSIILIILVVKLKEDRALFQPIGEPQTEIWFGPNHGSFDYLDLFSRDDLWENSRRNIDVFVLHTESLINQTTDPCPYCGNTSYKTLVQVDAFNKLNSWGVEIAIDVPAVKEWGCNATNTIPVTQRVIQNLNLAGSSASYLAMDEPYMGGELIRSDGKTCGYNMRQSANQTAIFIKSIKNQYPHIKLGDIEPYPRFNSRQLIDWVLELESNGAYLDFFHLDVNYLFGRYPPNVSELIELRDFFKSKNIEFGIIYWNDPKPPTSSNYTNGTLLWTNFVKKNKFYGTDHIIQSWVSDVPINLPETWVNVSHTNLILSALPIILDNDAQFLGQNVPNTMSSGQSYPVSVTFLNNGSEVWEEEESYKLISQNPSNNNIWGINEVKLNPQEKISPNEEKTFFFTVTAPTIQGVYDFQWRLIHEGIEIFGQPTNNLRINVEPSSTSPPNNPSNLVGSVNLPNNLKLDWTDNSDNEQGFILEYKSTSSQNWLIVPGANNLPPQTNSFTHSNIPAGNYNYRVGAFNQAGVSYSQPITITIDYGLTLSSLSPNKILKTASSVVSVIGTGFDENSKILINGLDITSIGLTSYINPGLITINFNPQWLRDLLGDYSISVRSGDGLVTTSSQNLRVNLPFDYLNLIPFSIVSLNPVESLDSFIEIQSSKYMDQETISTSFEPLTNIDIRFIGPSSCIVDTSLEIPLCRVNFTITPNSSSSGQYNLTFNSVSSVTSIKHQLNVTINVNRCGDGICRNGETCSSCSQDCGCGSSTGSSGGGGGGGGGGPPKKVLQQCEDGKDNDGDGLIDYPADLGCSSLVDSSEFDPSELTTNENKFDETPNESGSKNEESNYNIIFTFTLLILIIGIVILTLLIIKTINKNKMFQDLANNTKFNNS